MSKNDFKVGDIVETLKNKKRGKVISTGNDSERQVLVEFFETGHRYWQLVESLKHCKKKELSVGDMVKIKSGQYKGHKGRIIDIDPERETAQDTFDCLIETEHEKFYVDYDQIERLHPKSLKDYQQELLDSFNELHSKNNSNQLTQKQVKQTYFQKQSNNLTVLKNRIESINKDLSIHDDDGNLICSADEKGLWFVSDFINPKYCGKIAEWLLKLSKEN